MFSRAPDDHFLITMKDRDQQPEEDTALFVVPCSATKSRILTAGTPLPARDAYTGQAFRIARHQLEKAGQKWCILSGYYGFLWPSTVIENYDQKLQPVDESTVWDECFGAINNRQYGRLMAAKRVVVLGSKLYATATEVLLRRKVEAPLAGLPIGKMLQKLATQNFATLTHVIHHP